MFGRRGNPSCADRCRDGRDDRYRTGPQVKVRTTRHPCALYSANLAHAADSEFPFLGKPFLPKDLLDAVAECAGKPAGTYGGASLPANRCQCPSRACGGERLPLRWRPLSVAT